MVTVANTTYLNGIVANTGQRFDHYAKRNGAYMSTSCNVIQFQY